MHLQIYFDNDTLLHKPDSNKSHFECPQRVSVIKNDILNYKKQQEHQFLIKESVQNAEIKQLTLIHSQKYVDFIQNIWPEGTNKEVIYIGSSYFNKDTFKSAQKSAGGVIEACQDILSGQIKKAFTILRPPGHHICSNDSNIIGFCVFNNVAIGAKYLLSQGIKKIAIIDWDAHHGDGTQQEFYEDNQVLYVSWHRHDDGKFFPHKKEGNHTYIGKDIGKGYNINFSWNTTQYEVTDIDYQYTYKRLVEPILKEFQPEFILISCGFDSVKDDPLGGLNLKPTTYKWLTQQLCQIQEKIVCVLEGGYNLDLIGNCAVQVVEGLLFPDESIKEEKDDLSEGVYNLTEALCQNLSDYWKSINEEQQFQLKKKFSLSLKKNQIAGGHKKHFMKQGSRLLKMAKPREIEFYQNVYNSDALKQFEKLIPQYFGTTIINSQKWIILEDLTYQMINPSIIDVKLGKFINYPSFNLKQPKYEKNFKKNIDTSTNQLSLRLAGLILKDQKGNIIQDLDKSLNSTEAFTQYLKSFFSVNLNGKINQDAYIFVQDYLDKILIFLENQTQYKFIYTSIVICLDNINNNFKCKWIDFTYVDQENQDKIDENLVVAIKTFKKTLNDINVQQFNLIIIEFFKKIYQNYLIILIILKFLVFHFTVIIFYLQTINQQFQFYLSIFNLIRLKLFPF